VMSRSLVLKIVGGVFVVQVVVVMSAYQAKGVHAGEATTGTLNSATWRVCKSGLVAGQSATDHAMSQASRSQVSAYAVPCSGTYNVSSRAANYPDTWFGLTTCEGGSGANCNFKYVRLNAARISSSGQWRQVACHEFGHVGGLGHRSTLDSCMRSGQTMPPISETFDRHDIDALNNTY
jgi:hypothetical protein